MLTKKTKQTFILSTVYVLCSIAVTVFVLYTVTREGAALTAQSEIVLKNNIMEQQYSEVLTSLTSTEEERNVLKGHMLTEGDTVQFLSEIETLARKNGVQLTTNSLDVAPKKDTEFRTLAIKFSVDGSEQKVHTLLQVLETLPYHSQVTQLQLTRREDARGVASLSGNITLTLSLR